MASTDELRRELGDERVELAAARCAGAGGASARS